MSSAGNAAGSNEVSYMVVAGGGGGGGANRPNGNYASGAGGGAGGFREGKSTFCSHTASPLATTGLAITASAFPITIGGGGAMLQQEKYLHQLVKMLYFQLRFSWRWWWKFS